MRRILIPGLYALLLSTAPAQPLRVTTESKTIQPGSVVLLTVSSDDPVPTLRARAFNHDLSPFPIDTRTWQVLVGVDLDVRPGTHLVEIDEGGRDSRVSYPLVVKPRRFPTRTLKVDPDL